MWEVSQFGKIGEWNTGTRKPVNIWIDKLFAANNPPFPHTTNQSAADDFEIISARIGCFFITYMLIIK